MNLFYEYVVDNEIIVNEKDWGTITRYYEPEFIIQHLSDAIVEFNIKLPYRELELNDAIEDYKKLENLDTKPLIKEGKWGTKFDYKYPLMDTYVDISRVGNKASDYFHQVERWKCSATGYPSPQKTWENEKFRLTLFKALFSLKVKKINPTIFRNIISLRKYIASQFRPSAAKAIYDYFEAETVLDFSMGWGDRLAGAHASKFVKRYVGFDPNKNLYENYMSQKKAYGLENLSTGTYPTRAEDERISKHGEIPYVDNDEYDLVFTSPPYFDKEKYDESDKQSYKMYKKFDDWMENFLFKTIDIRTAPLKVGGYLAINISDIYTRKKRYYICDKMNDYIANTGNFEYIGAIGLRMPKRPMSKSFENVGIYGEPIWVHRKIR